ncbi:MAG: CHRD domain-containing protein [Chloroflexi bacterium]|nr:CHRD domain-containing protein [Chloroflexota bacterium]
MSRGMVRLVISLMAVLLMVPLLISPVAAVQPAAQGEATSLTPATDTDDPPPLPPIKNPELEDEEDADEPYERAEAFYAPRTAGDPDVKFTLADAAVKRAKAAEQVLQQQNQVQAESLSAFGGAWTPVGPDPIVQLTRGDISAYAVSGRVSALAIRSTAPYTIYLGGAQGGVWISSTLTTSWIPKTDQLASLAIGSIALAPSNENIVYVGTGEASLSGDSYYGNGILKSIDGGNTFSHVSGDAFVQVSVAKIEVDPTNPNHLFVATIRGRGGARRVSPPDPTPFGIYESTDGGVNWIGRLTTTDTNLDQTGGKTRGATDLVMDPLNPNILYASFLAQAIVKSTDGGLTWHEVMNGFPTNAVYNQGSLGTRFALGIGHPTAAVSATLYAGFEWGDTGGTHHASTIWKSTDEGASWTQTNTSVVGNYCGTQCTYDNLIGVDPTNPNIVYALGLFNYSTGSGGIFRSRDGGATWLDIGWNLHPDYHAFAVRRDAPQNIVIGNDGGVWSSSNYGGRMNPGDALDKVEWVNLNGTVNPNTAGVIARSGLAISQFTSVAQHPTLKARLYGGTQDNGTLRKSTASNSWFDLASGDGGQVLVDPNNPLYVYGSYYGISPYRFDDGMLGAFYSNHSIQAGINATDRSEFYVPWVLDPELTNRLYYGTFRVYRSDNRGDSWMAISPDLTSGCTGSAPNGARNCTITAFGVTAGAPAVYVGTNDGRVQITTNAYDDNPTWTRVDLASLPFRPVAAFAVDRSNYRIAYVAYNGFNQATPTRPGHVFKTTDGGHTWANISGNLPDIPVNALILDASDPNTLYAGTDVGPMITTNGGTTWSVLGSGHPIVSLESLDLNTYTRQLVSGTHGRGAWTLSDVATMPVQPALQIRKSDAGLPVGPGTLVTYTLTVKNIGNADATGVVITDPVPANTSFVSAENGGNLSAGKVIWMVGTVPISTTGTGGSVSVSFTVRVTDSNMVGTGTQIVNDGYMATAAEGVSATGSPYVITLAPRNDLFMTPAFQADGTRAGQTITYTVTIHNLGYVPDAYDLSAAGNAWSTTIWDPTFTTPMAHTGTVAPGDSTPIGVKVSVPLTATNGMTDTVWITAASVGDPTRHSSARIQTTAVTYDILLVNGDNGEPDVGEYYRAALDANGYVYDYWDVKENPVIPLRFALAHKAIVGFTGNSYPDPIGPYEAELQTFLDHGGRLFLSGWDILDQAAGTTDFVRNYLHIDWDGTEIQNDLGVTNVTAVPTNTVTGGMGTIPVDHRVLSEDNDFSDQITPIDPAVPAFWDDQGEADALTVAAGPYKVVFLAFPFEGLGIAEDRADLMHRVMNFFDVTVQPAEIAISANPATIQLGGSSTVSVTVTTENGTPVANQKVYFTTGDYMATLNSFNETPPITTTATGMATFQYDPATRMLHYMVSVDNISSITASHIHRGGAGVPGPVAYPLYTGGGNFGPGHPISGTVMLSPADEMLLLQGQLYVNVHTTAHPAGEIRGQILDGHFTATLTGMEETPPNTETSSGFASFTYEMGTRELYYTLEVSNIISITAAHIHRGAAGVPGPVAYGLYSGGGTFGPGHPLSGVVTLSAADEQLLLRGNLYVNVHTVAHSGGEIRGQILPGFVAMTDAHGHASVMVTGEEVGMLVVTAFAGEARGSVVINVEPYRLFLPLVKRNSQ